MNEMSKRQDIYLILLLCFKYETELSEIFWNISLNSAINFGSHFLKIVRNRVKKKETDSFWHKFRLLALCVPRRFEKTACDKSDYIGTTVRKWSFLTSINLSRRASNASLSGNKRKVHPQHNNILSMVFLSKRANPIQRNLQDLLIWV